jgi:hypothetical protein
MKDERNGNHGNSGSDPQPGHGKDDKGHNGGGNNGGIISKPGKSHAVTAWNLK